MKEMGLRLALGLLWLLHWLPLPWLAALAHRLLAEAVGDDAARLFIGRIDAVNHAGMAVSTGQVQHIQAFRRQES